MKNIVALALSIGRIARFALNFPPQNSSKRRQQPLQRAKPGKTGRFRVFLHDKSGCKRRGISGNSSYIRSASHIHPEIDAGMVCAAVEHKARRFLVVFYPTSLPPGS